MGQGRGGGGDEQSMVIGYGVAVGLIVFLCTFGIPMFIAGGVLVSIFPEGDTLVAGIVLLVLASLFTLVGIIFIILLCTGVIGQSNKTNPTVPATVTVVQSGQGQQQQVYATAYPPTGSWVMQGYSQQAVPPPYGPPPPPYSNEQADKQHLGFHGQSAAGAAPSYGTPSTNQLYGQQNPAFQTNETV